MSAVDELGARVRRAADELPVDLVARAVERLRAASELLLVARQQADRPGAVPGVAGALERAEHAGYALRTARGHLATYLAAIGLGATAPAPGGGPRPAPVPTVARRAPVKPEPVAAPSAPDWWARRVAALTDEPVSDERAAGDTDPERLLRQVADAVRDEDRSAVSAALAAAPAPVGLRLAALTPPPLRQLAADWLGHPPTVADVPRLTKAVAGRIRELLPGLPASVLDTLVVRVCRAPSTDPPAAHPADRPTEHAANQAAERPAAHPADAPVAGAVLTGVLLRLMDRAPEELDKILAEVATRESGDRGG